MILGLIFALTPAFNSATVAAAAPTCPVDSRHLVAWQGGRYFLSGVNVPWQNGGYGADFATIEEWGQHTYTHSATDTMFASLQASGVNTVRWWVFADGRGAPEFAASSGGAVAGLDATTLASMADAISLASQHNIRIVFNLWSFDMLLPDSTASARGEHAGGHSDLITDASKRSSFISKALLPMLAYPVPGSSYSIGNHPNVLGWDLFNEPEFGISDLGAVDSQIKQPVTLAQMQRFIAEQAGAIHRNSSQLVTVGSAAMKWNSDVGLGATGNVWKNSALTGYDAQGALDFYQIHYYGWMNGDGVNWSYAPTVIDWAKAGFDKPVVVGELPANAADTGYSVAGLLEKLHSNCYGGAWAWSYAGVDGAGSWSNIAAALKTFNTTYAAQVNIGSGTQPTATAAPAQPTATAVKPTATAAPAQPTATAVKPTATAAPAQPTATAVKPTATAAPAQPTATAVKPTATAAPAQPTATAAPAQPTATAAPTQAPVAAQTIYADSLAAGWQSWSWDTKINWSNTGKKKTGSASMSVSFTKAWAGLYLHTDSPLSTQGFSKVRFWAHGGNGGQRLMAWTHDGGNLQVKLPKLTKSWMLIEIPLSQLGSPSTLSELVIQDAAGVTQPTFYIDQLELAQ